MRIGIDISLLSINLSGVGVYIREMLKYFSEMDSENAYFLYSNRPINNEYVFPQKTTLRVVEKKPHLFWQIICLPGLIKQDRLDIYWEPNHCIPIMPKGPRYVVTVHDLAAIVCPQYAAKGTVIINKLFLRHTCKKADRIIAISEYTKKDIYRILNINNDKVSVIYNGDSLYDEHTFYDEHEKCEVLNKYNLDNYFLYVGNVHPRKNIITIIRAYEDYCTREADSYKLLIAGSFSWNTKEIEKIINTSSVKDKIIITGYVNDIELKYFYKNAKALVFPSRYEGFGLPILEAMSVGTIVITSKATSLPEVAGNAALYLNDLDNSKELSKIYSEVQHMDAVDKDRLIRNGYVQKSKFSRRKCACKILELFQVVYNE